MGEIIGYARCSSTGQNLDRQRDALAEADAARIFEDKMTGTRRDRPELNAMLDYARSGDTIVVTELARLGRSVGGLIDIVETMRKRDIAFKSLKENIDTTTSTGKLVFHVLSAIAEFERDVIAERAAEGRAAAKARGRTGGRPRVDQTKIDAAYRLIESGMSSAQAARSVGVGRATLYRRSLDRVAEPAA